MDSTILKEYLLSLGFKIDSSETKKFTETVGKFDINVMGLAKRLLAAGAAAQVMVALFSRSMEQMYYASQRTGSTVGNLQSMEFAAKQVGVSSDSMRGAIEGMARALRSNPGLTGLLQNLGVEVQGRDTSDVLTDLVTQLNKMPFYQASQYAGLFGINPDDLLLLEKGLVEFKQMRDLRKQMNAEAGLDADAAAKAGKEYDHLLARITARMGVLKDIILLEMLPGFTKTAEIIERIVVAATKWIGGGGAKKDINNIAPAVKNAATSYWDFTKKFWSMVTGGDQKEQPAPGAAPATANKSKLPIGLRNNNPGNLRSWGQTATEGGFAKFDSAADGLSAMAGNLLSYYKKYGLDTITGIVKRWAPPNENNTKAYIESLVKQTGFGADAKLNLQDPNVLAALMAGITKHENGSNPFSSSQFLGAASARLGGVQLTQTNTFNITSPDPTAAAAKVSSAQTSANADMTRNLRRAVE